MEKYKPLGDLVLIKPEEAKPYHEYKGLKNIVVPEAFEHGPEDRNVWGTVVALGPKCGAPNIGVVKGDRVMVGKFSGEYIKLQGERKYLLVREIDILCKEV